MTTRYYMRVEAVNLSHFVYDTHDISTIRGGSFILIEVIKVAITEKFEGRLYPISTAASQGLFFFDCQDQADEDNVENLRVEVLEFLQKETQGHATFLVAIEKDEENFPLTLEKLEAQIHRQQWRMPTVAIPKFEATKQECYLDGWRPGVAYYGVDPDIKNTLMSAAAEIRRDYGVKIKHRLFYKLLDDDKYKDNLCTKDLGELALASDKGVLDGKIAFIYIDGNSFGRIRRDLCITPELRKQFDQTIQENFRKPFLKTLLQRADQDPHFHTKDTKKRDALRLEVLLWGGDEMTLVVPAWKGWEVLQLFFEQAKNLSFTDRQLSHRAVIIFCHHNAPILQIRQLAEELLGQTKQNIQKNLEGSLKTDPNLLNLSDEEQKRLTTQLSQHEYGDALHYLVLESFDMLRGSLSHFLSRYYQGVSYSTLLILAHQLDMLRENFNLIRANVARSKILEVITTIQQGQPERRVKVIQQIYSLLAGDQLNQVQAAITFLNAEPARWYMVADLWDYIPEWKAL